MIAALACFGLFYSSGEQASLRAIPQALTRPSKNRPPVTDAGGPYSGAPGRGVLFSATHSTDPDGDTLAFAWDFGDGQSASEPSPTHSYAAVGTYVVTVLASDSKGGLDIGTARVVIMKPSRGNLPPVAVHNGPYVSPAKSEIVIDASSSKSPYGETLAFLWQFGDGTYGSGPTLLHAYDQPGTYTVRLLVTDGKGGATMRTTIVVIAPAVLSLNNHQPMARPAGPASAFAGAIVKFSGLDSSDPDGDPLNLTWVFGDDDSATGSAPTHIFSRLGKHTVTLIASDGRGGLATSSVDINIERTEGNEYPIASTGGPYSGVVGVPVDFDASASKDPDGDEVHFAWNFGDGGKGSGSNPQHVYIQPGTFPVTILVSDDNGDTVTASTTVVVIPPPGRPNHSPVAKPGGPYAGSAGKSVTLDGSGSLDPDKDQLTYEWAFGDGTSGVAPKVTHTYANPGAYTVMLLITDGKGGSAAALTMVTIGTP